MTVFKIEADEIPLYQGHLPSPVRFDESGLVVLGCNIHDQMLGHILVVDTPIYGITDEHGLVSLEQQPQVIAVWYPGMETFVTASTSGAKTEVRLDHVKPHENTSLSGGYVVVLAWLVA